jgi:hypothetical protein
VRVFFAQDWVKFAMPSRGAKDSLNLRKREDDSDDDGGQDYYSELIHLVNELRKEVGDLRKYIDTILYVNIMDTKMENRLTGRNVQLIGESQRQFLDLPPFTSRARYDLNIPQDEDDKEDENEEPPHMPQSFRSVLESMFHDHSVGSALSSSGSNNRAAISHNRRATAIDNEIPVFDSLTALEVALDNFDFELALNNHLADRRVSERDKEFVACIRNMRHEQTDRWRRSRACDITHYNHNLERTSSILLTS